MNREVKEGEIKGKRGIGRVRENEKEGNNIDDDDSDGM
ncbi:Variable outer membrane protein (plasmid) [Borrelia crocidurae DOU]|uniref:Variable outer membrane protein n=1 Tax=Borrelia crocidurae DOU TaxID=1293575 RepID=W5SPB9_9SPIR|nr:Variable outer membrane protein [Borrelia crocidurae DOU]